MLEYTSAFLSPFSWARAAYKYHLGLSMNERVNISSTDLVSPSYQALSSQEFHIRTSVEWNNATREEIAAVGALFTATDQVERYILSLQTQLSARISESEKRVQELENALKTIKTGSRYEASTSITIRGGDTGWIEANPDYYTRYGMLERVGDEAVFRLRDTGHFSSIRSLGGFAGRTFIEQSLGHIEETGTLAAITDGSSRSFWVGTQVAPAPLRAQQADVPWLSKEYSHGSAVLLTYYLDRPTLASEVFIDPVTTEPFDVVAITWSPLSLLNVIASGATFETAGLWNLHATASIAASGGVGGSNCLLCQGASGWASYYFEIKQALAPVVSGIAQPIDDDYTGVRAQLTYAMRGDYISNLRAGARIVWLDATGSVLDYKLIEEYPTAFFASKQLVDYIPRNAVSGRVDLGIFSTITSPASAYFDSAELLLGEARWDCNVRIDRPTTITLRNVALSNRFSFLIAQRNPRREVRAVEGPTEDFVPIQGLLDLDPSLQKSTQILRKQLLNSGTGESVFAYRIGIKELDLRYREHVPRGSLVSLPLKADREIRRLWVTTELGKHHNSEVKFLVYPFSADADTTTELTPYRAGEIDVSEVVATSAGQILHIYTPDELTEGWYNPADKYFVVRPTPRREVFDGTDREGKIALRYPPHTRTTRILSRDISRGIQTWLDVYSILPSVFDPNAETLYGAAESASGTIFAIRERQTVIPGLELTQLKTFPGYLPIKVTVETGRWTAHPDTLGRPDRSRVRFISGELLAETTLVETVVESQKSPISFDAWLNTKTDREINLIAGVVTSLYLQGKGKDAYDRLGEHHRSIVKRYYDSLVVQGKVPMEESQSTTRTAAVERDDTYKTKYSPIIAGPTGTSLSLFTRNPDTDEYLPLSQNDFSVDPAQGLVKILTTFASGFTELYGSYRYISNSNTEDFFSSVVGHLTQGASAISDIAGAIGTKTRSLPVTRNMTDYIGGKIPTLRSPNFERLSKDYYPIIEYYVTPRGELVFSRDFFQYGDMPARITVEYETLALEPRIAVQVNRSGSPSASPQLRSVSLHVQEGAAGPKREVD